MGHIWRAQNLIGIRDSRPEAVKAAKTGQHKLDLKEWEVIDAIRTRL